MINTSPITADFLIKSSKNRKMDFTSILQQSKDMFSRIGRPLVTNQGNKIIVDTFNATLEPN